MQEWRITVEVTHWVLLKVLVSHIWLRFIAAVDLVLVSISICECFSALVRLKLALA